MSVSLETATGSIQGLEVFAGEEEFVHFSQQRSVAVGTAAGLAMSGLSGAAVGASMAASAADSVEFFQCKLGERLVRGRFAKVSFLNGDTLTVVVERQQEGAHVVLAAQRDSDRKIWMVPHCSRGTRAHARFSVKMFFILFACLLVLLGGAFGLMEYFNQDVGSPNFRTFWMSLVGVMSLIMSAYYSVRFYRQWLPVARQAEAILSALGYEDPASVDLPKEHAAYCRSQGIKWPYPTEGSWIYFRA